MIELFKNLSEGWQIAIFGAGVALVGGLSPLLKGLFPKKNDSSASQETILCYDELWKALVEVRKTAVITPTLDNMPIDKSPYDVYSERLEIAVEAFNKAKNLFEDNRPFYHDTVRKITRELLHQCRAYIRSVGKMLKSENFNDELEDKADELLEKIPKAIDEIEKVIKGRIGLLQKAKIVE